jgi:hypothetical protein
MVDRQRILFTYAMQAGDHLSQPLALGGILVLGTPTTNANASRAFPYIRAHLKSTSVMLVRYTFRQCFSPAL